MISEPPRSTGVSPVLASKDTGETPVIRNSRVQPTEIWSGRPSYRSCDPVNLLIVILNYRTPKLTVDCLESLKDKQAEIPGGFRAVVVENGSADGSAAVI